MRSWRLGTGACRIHQKRVTSSDNGNPFGNIRYCVGSGCRGAFGDLPQDRSTVEVDPLASHAVALVFENKEGRHLAAEGTARWLYAHEPSLVRTEEDELDDHRVVGIAKREQLVALIGKRGTRTAKVVANLGLAVEDEPCRDEFVVRMREGSMTASKSRRFSASMCSRATASRRLRKSEFSTHATVVRT